MRSRQFRTHDFLHTAVTCRARRYGPSLDPLCVGVVEGPHQLRDGFNMGLTRLWAVTNIAWGRPLPIESSAEPAVGHRVEQEVILSRKSPSLLLVGEWAP
jgi:hypothetical protein